MNGWQFHDYNVPRISEAIVKAPEYGVNFFIFSHGLFHSVQEFLDSPPRQEAIRTLGQLADERGIPWYLWIHELDDIPDRFRTDGKLPDAVYARQVTLQLGKDTGIESLIPPDRVDLDHPELLEFLRERYERVLALAPSSAGFVLTFHEAQNKVFRDSQVKSSLSVTDRIYTISKLVYDVARAHGKTLIVRNFFYEPRELEYFAAAMDRLPDDVISMSKDVVHDFQPFYPFDPLHGQMGAKRQIMELDLGTEKSWGARGPYAQVDYIQRDLRRARETGMTGAVGRARLYGERPFEHLQEINLYAFARFMEDPDASADAVFTDWARQSYPEPAVPHLVSALKRTEFIQQQGRYIMGYRMTTLGGDWDDYLYYFGHILLRSRSKWTNDPADYALDEAMYYPDQAMFDRLVAEREEVIRQVRLSQADLERAAPFLAPEQLEPLRAGFEFLLDSGEVTREWVRAFFAQRMWMQQPTAETAAIVEDALSKLEVLGRKPGPGAPSNPNGPMRYNIDDFALEMRWRMANRERALDEDERILEDVRGMMDVDRN